MQRQTRLSGGLTQRYRAKCQTCGADSDPVRERFAEQQAEKHEAETGHEVTVEPVEQTRENRGDAIREVFEGP